MNIQHFKTKLVITLIFCIFIFSCNSKNSNQSEFQDNMATQVKKPKPLKVSSSDSIFRITEIQGAFLGTEEERLRNLTPNPKKFKVKEKISVFLEFVIEKDSTVQIAEVLKGSRADLNKEAIRLIRSVKWMPGIQNGEIVRSKLAYGIPFLPE